jgi:uncharacterized tellurite resistance protein B-like protein
MRHHGAMLRSLLDLFDALRPPLPEAAAADAEHALQLAAAVLLVEVRRADPGCDAAERRAVVAALREKFALTDDEVARLHELADQAARTASDLYRYTSRIDQTFDMPRKIRLVELMWRVAYADGEVSAHERHLVWRVADLLHVPQGARVHARLRASGAGADAAEGPA